MNYSAQDSCSSGSSGGNRLLSLLRADDLAALEPYLEPYPLKAGLTLLKPNAPVADVYFVQEGLVSLVQLMESGKLTEIGLVGREGLVGAVALLGPGAFSHEAVVQVSGSGLRIKADRLRAEAALRPGLQDVLMRYVQALFCQVAQWAACNNQHGVSHRLARRLAMGADCIGSDDLPFTHELLSLMLGVRRSSVTEALTLLKRDGAITTHQGGVAIADRAALLSASCECHGIVRTEFRRLLGPSVFQEAAAPSVRG